jgi:Uma2 family endonuclease
MSQTLPLEISDSPVKMTFEQYLSLGEDDLKSEWVDGEVHYMSPVSKFHQRVSLFLIWLIETFVSAHRIGQVFYEPFVMKTGPDLPGRSPDVLFIANEHLDRVKINHLEGPADLAVEIISPDSRRRDRVTKRKEYAKGGVREYWIIDPQNRQAEFLRLNEDGAYEPIPLNDGVFQSQVLEGFWLRVNWLWNEPRPSLIDILKEWKLIG